jgi:hypothetical protein
MATVAREPDVEESDVTVHFVTPEERWAIFDQAAQHYLHMSGEEFIRAWDAGEFAEDPDHPAIVSVYMLRPSDR